MSRADVMRAADAQPERAGVPRLFHRLWSPFWIAFVGWLWWAELGQQLASRLPEGATDGYTQAATVLAAVGHVAGNAIEALFYVQWWRSRGTRLAFARLFEWLVSLSLLDLLAFSLARVAESHPGWIAGVLEVFAGFGTVRGDDLASVSGLRVAFGSVGLLCVTRLVATAAIQRQGTGARLAAPLALTVTAWLICRVVSWWTFDLARGMSSLY